MPMPDRAQAPARPPFIHPTRWRLLAGTALLATMAALSGCGGGGGGSSFGFAGFPPPSGPVSYTHLTLPTKA